MKLSRNWGWLLANAIDQLTTLVGLSLGHPEINVVTNFTIKWTVVVGLPLVIWATKGKRLNYVLRKTMVISMAIVWLGVIWNMAVIVIGQI